MTNEPLKRIEVDDTTWRFIEMLRELLAQEPPAPDLDIHDGYHLNLVAQHYYEWERHCGALRLLIGVRLTNKAIKQ